MGTGLVKKGKNNSLSGSNVKNIGIRLSVMTDDES